MLQDDRDGNTKMAPHSDDVVSARRFSISALTPRILFSALGLAIAALLVGTLLAQRPDANISTTLQQARTDFRAGRISDSVAAFDRAMALEPRVAPELWDRGIALYYAGRFRDCRAQFELHRTVNPADVENAAWHYLCVARAENPDRAREALLPVKTDPREPMREVYLMFAGKVSTESVLVAGIVSPSARFYASLYVGLYYEAQGDATRAQFYIAQAASDQFSDVGGYMATVAKVHMQVRKWTAPAPQPLEQKQ